MKKLSKIKLQNAVVLENQEMKVIFGGSGANSSSCSGGGINNSTCSGPCPPRDEWNPVTMRMDSIPQTCKGITGHAADGSGFLTACGCM